MSFIHVLFKRISPHHHLITSAAYVAALLVVCIFPSFDRRTEIEEHGLIAGYAHSGLNNQWAASLRSVIKGIEKAQSVDSALEWATAEAQLIAHRKNFTTPGGQQSSVTYTVVASSRGDSREAVVLLVAFNRTAAAKSVAKAAMPIGIGVVLAQYLKTVHWLSKDVFVVFVDSSLPYGAGARAWLRDYFGGSSAVRRGVLRQAVILETSSKATSLICDVEGINGAVPNQDIVNAYMVSTRDKPNLQVFHREAWDSVYHHLGNGGVHSSHAPFLELQVPAFTVRGQRISGRTAIDPHSLMASLEGIIRCLSNNLQQLHHSFNFYFFTGQNSHISSGLYLYPVFAMQLPLISFLMTLPSYRDIRSLLVGLGSIAVTIVASGGPIFLLATEPELVHRLGELAAGASLLSPPPTCISPGWGKAEADKRRIAVATWLSSGAAGAAVVAFLLRRYAFRVFDEGAADGAAASGKGVRLPAPLWEAIRAASGFAFLIILAPVTIYSWAVAVPLTMVCVPLLILVRPFSLRRRPARSLLVLALLAGNAFLLAAPPATRSALLGEVPGQLAAWCWELYDRTILPAVPAEARKYMPTPLVSWLQRGRFGATLQGDMLLGLHEAARDFNCVGGMIFPIFCFVYWPLLVFAALVTFVLPAQRVEDEGLSFGQLRLGVIMVLSLVLGGVAGGVVWRSYSSSGLGKLQW